MIEKRKTQAIITFFLLAASVIWMVASRGKVEEMPLEYEEVQVTVISAETHRRKMGSSRSYSYDVVVEYEGTQYDLINVKSGEMARYEALANLSGAVQANNPYFDNTVYLSNGKMYSNIDGIKTDGKEFTWYMIGLGGAALFGILHLMCVADLVDRKKKQKQDKTRE
ncbi:MAG: DUF3592 domain-containing protein [Lachnospiraceae bacterium]|nr:DUF3592 domain-containing protein [Lachnospiraceae bacterium]